MSDRRGYSFPAAELERGSQWGTSTQHPPRYPAPPNAFQGVTTSAYPAMANTAHSVAPAHPPVTYPGDYTGFSPLASSQYITATQDTYHQPRQSYSPTNHTHQAPTAVPHYTAPQHHAQHHQPNIHHQTSPYYGPGNPQYQQPQYPASPSRPFSCDLCALSFNRQHDLKRHRETHSGEKPFLCNGGCGKTFTRKDALKRHQLVKHCGHEEEVS